MPAFSNSFSLAMAGGARPGGTGGDGSIADLFRRFAERRNGPKPGAGAPLPGARPIKPVKPLSILGGASRPKTVLGY